MLIALLTSFFTGIFVLVASLYVEKSKRKSKAKDFRNILLEELTLDIKTFIEIERKFYISKQQRVWVDNLLLKNLVTNRAAFAARDSRVYFDDLMLSKMIFEYFNDKNQFINEIESHTNLLVYGKDTEQGKKWLEENKKYIEGVITSQINLIKEIIQVARNIEKKLEIYR